MNTNIIARATNSAMGALKNALTLEKARTAYYMFPRRDTLFGMVAMAHWDGFALGVSTTILGLCGDGDFPSEDLKLIALRSYAESVLQEGGDGDVSYELGILSLLMEATEDQPARLDENQMACIASFLSFAAPRNGEAELFLCNKFPDTLSLIPVFERKLKERYDPASETREIIKMQGELIEFLRNKVASLERAKQ